MSANVASGGSVLPSSSKTTLVPTGLCIFIFSFFFFKTRVAGLHNQQHGKTYSIPTTRKNIAPVVSLSSFLDLFVYLHMYIISQFLTCKWFSFFLFPIFILQFLSTDKRYHCPLSYDTERTSSITNIAECIKT